MDIVEFDTDDVIQTSTGEDGHEDDGNGESL